MIATQTTPETMTLNRVTYNVLSREMVKDMEAKYPNAAADLMARGISAVVGLQRPKGHKVSMGYLDNTGKLFWVLGL